MCALKNKKHPASGLSRILRNVVFVPLLKRILNAKPDGKIRIGR